MKIAVFGLGYVGCVSAASLAAAGHEVTGVDIDPWKIELVRNGRVPVLEPGLSEIVEQVVASGHLKATDDGVAAVMENELSLVCVGTPSRPANGSIDTTALERVAEIIGRGIAESEGRHTVVIRSTVVPGTTESVVIPALERMSGLTAGEDFGVAVNPEFLREGTSVKDFKNPPKTVIGQIDDESGEPVESLYAGLDAPLFRLSIREAELVKYVDNAFHALKIGFANEIGAIAEAFSVDAQEVMRVFRSDTKLNISPAYLSPGFAFGGSCLPKDLRALVHAAHRRDVAVPILENVLPSNDAHIRRALDAITSLGLRRVGLFGLAFKSGTDDLRESPLVELAERLIGKGFELKIYDPRVSVSKLVGANKAFVEAHLPHLSRLLVDSPAGVIEHAEVVILGRGYLEASELLRECPDLPVIDLNGPVASAAPVEEYVGHPA
jgi:GDP-mannose 6-dehydrogenase